MESERHPRAWVSMRWCEQAGIEIWQGCSETETEMYEEGEGGDYYMEREVEERRGGEGEEGIGTGTGTLKLSIN